MQTGRGDGTDRNTGRGGSSGDLPGRLLMLDGRALERMNGPALVVARDGAVIAANRPAGSLVVDGAVMPALVDAVHRVSEEGLAQPDLIEVPGPRGRVVFDCLLTPLADGAVLVVGRDVTLDENLRTALVESRQRYKELVEVSSDFAWETNAAGRFVFVSPRGALGFAAEELVGRAAADFLAEPPDDPAALPFSTEIQIEDAEVWMRTALGQEACLLASAVPLSGGLEGETRGARGVCRDVTELREREAALQNARNHERMVIHIVRTLRDEVDPENMLSVGASALRRALGVDGVMIHRQATADDGPRVTGTFVPAAWVGTVPDPEAARPLVETLVGGNTGDGPAEGGLIEAGVDGLAGLLSATAYGQTINGTVGLWRTVTPGDGDRAPVFSEDDRLLFGHICLQIGVAIEQLANHRRIVILSRTDPLTGLFNRRAFFEELERRYARLSREHRSAALIYADLDNFKLVNDVHGHQVGDTALLVARDLLVGHARPTDLVARLGGDEFALWLEGADADIAAGRARTLLEAAQVLDRFSGAPTRPFRMSLGIAIRDPGRDETLDQLLLRADGAMYTAKREGKGSYRVAPPVAADTPAGGSLSFADGDGV